MREMTPHPIAPDDASASPIAIDLSRKGRGGAAEAEPKSRRADPFAPLTSQHLAVGNGHEIYYETVGRADGIPAVYLHGGPGSGCQTDHRRLFDPDRFHAVLFDQRGSGRSRPKGRREDNTLAHLIADMEMIRDRLD